jgi:predicted metal-binding membrane protein
MALRRETFVAAAVVGGALVGWILALERMRGMDAGPGTDPGGLAWYVGIWVTMTAAMMLPSAAPTVALFSRFRGASHSVPFALGYLLAWTGYGLVAYALARAIRSSAPSFLTWDEHGPWIAGGALAAAGLYQLTPLKTACLRHCRSPLHFLVRSGPGALGALRTGIGHGAYCVGCCAGLMLALFALGVMSLVWMAVVAAAILVEKLLPVASPSSSSSWEAGSRPRPGVCPA